MSPFMSTFNSGSSRAIGFKSGECKKPIQKDKVLQLNHSTRYVIDVTDPSNCTAQNINTATGLPTGAIENLNGTLEVIFANSTIAPPQPFAAASAAANGDEDVNLPPSLPLSIVPGSVEITGAARASNLTDSSRSWTGGIGARLVSVVGTVITIDTISYVINNGTNWVVHNGQEQFITIKYKIRNNCGSLDDGTSAGMVGSVASAQTSISMFVGEQRRFEPVPRAVVNMNINLTTGVIDSNLPSELDAGWYVMAFDTYTVLDNFWIEMRAGVDASDYWRDTDGDGTLDTPSTIYWGRIGPIGDADGKSAPVTNILTSAALNTYYPSPTNPAVGTGAEAQGQGWYCAYKPPGYSFNILLNVFNNEGSGLTVGAAKAYKPNEPEAIVRKYPGYTKFANAALWGTLDLTQMVQDMEETFLFLYANTNYQIDFSFTWTNRLPNSSITIEITDSINGGIDPGSVLNRDIGEDGINGPLRVILTDTNHNDAAVYRMSFTNVPHVANPYIVVTFRDATGASVSPSTIGTITGNTPTGDLRFEIYRCNEGYDYTYAPPSVQTVRASLAAYPNPTRYYTATSNTWAVREKLPVTDILTGAPKLDHNGNPVYWQAVSGWVYSDPVTKLCLIQDAEPNPARYFLDPNIRPTNAEIANCFANLVKNLPARSGIPQGSASMSDCPRAYQTSTTGYEADAIFSSGSAIAGRDRTPWTVWPRTGQAWPNVWPWPAEVLGPGPRGVLNSPALQASTTTGTFTPDFTARTIRVAPITAAGTVNTNGFGGQMPS